MKRIVLIGLLFAASMVWAQTNCVASGASGNVWVCSSKGAKGDTGATGAAGNDGKDGSQGPAGPQGATGPAGTNGQDGKDGKDGANGSQGPVGPAGATGATGPQGTPGPIGATGPQGPNIPGLTSDGASGIIVVGAITAGTGSSVIGLTAQPTATCPVPTGVSAALCLNNAGKLTCTLAGGGSC